MAELPGCYSQVDSLAALEVIMREAIQVYLERDPESGGGSAGVACAPL